MRTKFQNLVIVAAALVALPVSAASAAITVGDGTFSLSLNGSKSVSTHAGDDDFSGNAKFKSGKDSSSASYELTMLNGDLQFKSESTLERGTSSSSTQSSSGKFAFSVNSLSAMFSLNGFFNVVGNAGALLSITLKNSSGDVIDFLELSDSKDFNIAHNLAEGDYEFEYGTTTSQPGAYTATGGFNVTVSPVHSPEPATLTMCAICGLMAGGGSYLKRRKSALSA